VASSNQSTLAREARAIFEKIKESLEASHPNEFVAIEPTSGEFFLGTTLSDAIGASRKQHPDRLAHAFRVGHKAAVHFGLHIR
jgi:hypothetical protein